jgi:enoyl-CoA hydratase/carnithine racemase
MALTAFMTTSDELTLDTVSLERDGHVLVIGLNRPEKRNAFNRAMLADLSRAYAVLEADDSLRAGVLFAHVRGAQVPAGPADGRAGRAKRRLRHRTRAQDGPEGFRHL